MILFLDDMLFDWANFLVKKFNKNLIDVLMKQHNYIEGLDLSDIYKYDISLALCEAPKLKHEILIPIDISKEGFKEKTTIIKDILKNNFNIIYYQNYDELKLQLERYNKKIECVMSSNFNYALNLTLDSKLKNIALVLYHSPLYDNELIIDEKVLVDYIRENNVRISMLDRTLTEDEAKKEGLV